MHLRRLYLALSFFSRSCGGPFGVLFVGPTSAADCDVTCPTTFIAGQHYLCTIVARDKYGNAVPSTTDNFVATLLPAADGSSVETVNDGQ